MTSHDEPVNKAEERATRMNPEGQVAPLVALQTVVLWTLTDAFGLVPEETMWASYHLDEILSPLMGKEPTSVPLAVRQEMLDKNYSAALERMESRDDRFAAATFDPAAKRATAHDWAAVTLQMITECYRMRPMEESAMTGLIVGLLRELGVDDATNPRPARYLPNDVRHRLDHA